MSEERGEGEAKLVCAWCTTTAQAQFRTLRSATTRRLLRLTTADWRSRWKLCCSAAEVACKFAEKLFFSGTLRFGPALCHFLSLLKLETPNRQRVWTVSHRVHTYVQYTLRVGS